MEMLSVSTTQPGFLKVLLVAEHRAALLIRRNQFTEATACVIMHFTHTSFPAPFLQAVDV